MVSFVEVLRSERDARRDTHRQRSGRALGDGRLDGDRALDDVGGDVGLPAGERDAFQLDVVGHASILRMLERWYELLAAVPMLSLDILPAR